MKNISDLNALEEIKQLQDNNAITIKSNIPLEAFTQGSIGVLAAGYQGIVAWRQMRQDKTLNDSSNQNQTN